MRKIVSYFFLALILSIISLTIYLFFTSSKICYSFYLDHNNNPTTIPNNNELIQIIHQSWKTYELPSRFVTWSNSWKTCFPNWEYKLWSNNDNRNFIQIYYPWFLTVYDALPKDIHRADAMRYFYMFHYGGIYADLDTECLKPFEFLLTNQSIAFGAMEGQYRVHLPEGYVQNSFFYSKPKQLFWLEVIMELIHREKETSTERKTGPILLINIINDYRLRFAQKNHLIIYPPKYFNPFSWIKNSIPLPKSCKTLNRMSMNEYLDCKKHFNESFVIQYHAKTWANGKII